MITLRVSLLTSCMLLCHALVPSFVPPFTSRNVLPHVSRTVAFSTDTDKGDSPINNVVVNGDDEILSLLGIDASDDKDDDEEEGDVLVRDELLGLAAEADENEDEDEETKQDKLFMLEAINMARSSGGERSPSGK